MSSTSDVDDLLPIKCESDAVIIDEPSSLEDFPVHPETKCELVESTDDDDSISDDDDATIDDDDATIDDDDATSDDDDATIDDDDATSDDDDATSDNDDLLSIKSESDSADTVIIEKKRQKKSTSNNKRLPSLGDRQLNGQPKRQSSQSHLSTVITDTSDSDSDNNKNGNEKTQFTSNADIATASSHQQNVSIEITLSESEEEENGPGENREAANNSQTSTSSGYAIGEGESASSSDTRYGLRRKRKINYLEVENGVGMEVDAGDKTRSKREMLDIFSLTDSKLAKFIKNPDLVESFRKCRIVFMHGTDSSRLRKVTEFFKKCGQQFESMYVQIRYDESNYSFLENILKNSSALSRLDYRYKNQDDAYELLNLLKGLREANCLTSLSSLKLVSSSGSENLRERHMALLSEILIQFHSLELGDSLWEDVKSATIENFMEKQKNCLETLILQGGFRGSGDSRDERKMLISFPKMEILKTLCICPKYAFLSEFKSPHSKKARVVIVDVDRTNHAPFKVAVKFPSPDLPKLQRLVLGNMIDVEDLLFSTVRKLVEFRCGSFWNLAICFPSEVSRKVLMESSVTDFQFPDALKDPTFTVKVAKHFPNLKKVWLYLPSVPVLRAFFKAFEKSNLEELYLKTQFDFENSLESCLLPNLRSALKKSKETESLLATLREYKHFDEYIRYYNVELPVEEEDLMAGHSAGIGALKSLKVLHLEHIPRNLLIPIPDDERKWYDHNCKFMSTTFGYDIYPMKYRCHQEIVKLDLRAWTWKNIRIRKEFTEDLYEAGFVDIPDVLIIGEEIRNNMSGYNSDDDEDIFMPIKKSAVTGTQIKIMPSMLFPSIKAKSEDM